MSDSATTVSTPPQPTPVEIALHSPVHPAFVVARQQLSQLQEWAEQHVWKPLVAVSVELHERASVAMAPHIAKLQTIVEPYTKRIVAFAIEVSTKCEPHVERLKLKAIELHKDVKVKAIELHKEIKPHAERLAEQCCVLSVAAKDKVVEQSEVVRRKSIVWVEEQKKQSEVWIAQQQVELAKSTKLLAQVWEGAVAGAKVAHQGAHELHALRARLQTASDIKAECLRAEDFDGAKRAKAAEVKLLELASQAEPLVLSKVEALVTEDYAAALEKKTALDAIVAESEAEVCQLGTPRAKAPPVSAEAAAPSEAFATAATTDAAAPSDEQRGLSVDEMLGEEDDMIKVDVPKTNSVGVNGAPHKMSPAEMIEVD